MREMERKLDLQLFAEGAGAQEQAAGAQGTTVAGPADDARGGTVEKSADDARESERAARGESQDASARDARAESENGAQGRDAAAGGEAFEELIKGRYKKNFDEHVQRILKERLKDAKRDRDTLEKLAPALELLRERYAVEDGNLEALAAKIADDDEMYQEEANERGLSVKTLKQIKALERDKARADRERAERAAQERMQAHYQKLVEQSEAMKALYPSFELRKELENPDFLRLTSPQVGVDVRTAYEVVHRDELRPMEMRFAAEKSAEKIAKSVQAGAMRPQENGVAQGAAAVAAPKNRKWTSEELRDIRRRVARGEKVYI